MKKHALTTNEAADILGFARTSVINWVEKGELKSFLTPGGHRRFDMEDIVAFANKRGIQIEQEDQVEDETKRVLVVDDDQDFRQFSLETLEIAGNFEVKEAANGIEAALITGSWKPHVILLDLHMPQMDGYQFIDQLRNDDQFKEIKIIILTAYADDETRERVGQVHDLICKPIGIKDFVNKLREIAQ